VDDHQVPCSFLNVKIVSIILTGVFFIMRSLTDNAFSEPRKDGDICLVMAITQELERLGHPNPTAWHDDPIIQEALTASPKLQQFLINRHWRQSLGLCDFNTSLQRFCLFDDSSAENYLKVFRDAVIPTIVEHALV
jgi:hypothetical protein